MKAQADTARTNRFKRRELLKRVGFGTLIGSAAGLFSTKSAMAQSLIHAMWTHGSSLQVEFPERTSAILHRGFHTHVEGNPGTENWFHFAIPTPVIVSETRARIDSVVVKFKTGSVDAFVDRIHIYDGPLKIASFDDLRLSGNHGIDYLEAGERFNIPESPPILWGIDIAVGAGFGVESLDHWMQFSAAGADFIE